MVTAFAMGMKTIDASMAQEVIEDVLCLSTEKLKFNKPKPYVVSNLDRGKVPTVAAATGQSA